MYFSNNSNLNGINIILSLGGDSILHNLTIWYLVCVEKMSSVLKQLC